MANLEYKCPNCGGSLSFSSSSQKLTCPYCEAEFDVDAFKSYTEDLENTHEEKLDWGESETKEFSEEELKSLNSYHCDCCGAEIMADENTSATTCPFCESPVILTGRVAGVLKPDYVIPFKYDKEASKAALSKYLKKKLFLPNSFKTENKIDEIKGLYVPFWVYSSDCEGKVFYRGETKRRWVRGDYEYTETKYYSIIREGCIGFDHIPVDGSSKMDDKLMETIEPFDFDGAVRFNPGYLSGYLSDKYDVDKDSCQGRANSRVKEGTIDGFRTTIHGYDHVSYEKSNLSLFNQSAVYAYYPVWVLNSSFKNKKFEFAMNAQTGKLTGNLPLSVAKYLISFFSFFLGIGGILFLSFFFGIKEHNESWIAMQIIAILLGLIPAIVFCEINRKKLKPVKFQRGAASYYREGSMDVRTKRDIYLYRKVTSRKINNSKK